MLLYCIVIIYLLRGWVRGRTRDVQAAVTTWEHGEASHACPTTAGEGASSADVRTSAAGGKTCSET